MTKRNLKEEGQQRAYCAVEWKAVGDDTERIIEGTASTAETDRMGDIVEPKGAIFKLPIPLLWQHDRHAPIGHVIEAKVTDSGITMRARLVKVLEEGNLKSRLDEAWQTIKYGLVRGLSIGFNPIEHAQIDGTWGYRFTKWEWLELSPVTIPANAGASIQTIKSLDQAMRRTASGAQGARPVVRLDPAALRGTSPGATGSATRRKGAVYL
jgi:HK97 family phage prohead protease